MNTVRQLYSTTIIWMILCCGLSCALQGVYHLLDASSAFPRFDSPQCLQTLPNVLWG